jgi:hypothetical protein
VVVALGVLGGLGTTVILARRRTQRVEREAAAVSELRQVLHAEMAYAQANGGRYDRLQCLSDPAACIPRYPAGGPRFLGAGATPLEARQGYRFLFYSGPPPERIDPARASPSSLAAFAYVAVPDVAAGLSGRSFCTDASRRVCELKAQDPHALAEGACPLTCVDLR